MPDPTNAELAALVAKASKRLLKALDRLDEGCTEPGFYGWENGNGIRVGDEIQNARKNLAKLLTKINA
jgi:hypothetical protein